MLCVRYLSWSPLSSDSSNSPQGLYNVFIPLSLRCWSLMVHVAFFCTPGWFSESCMCGMNSVESQTLAGLEPLLQMWVEPVCLCARILCAHVC